MQTLPNSWLLAADCWVFAQDLHFIVADRGIDFCAMPTVICSRGESGLYEANKIVDVEVVNVAEDQELLSLGELLDRLNTRQCASRWVGFKIE